MKCLLVGALLCSAPLSFCSEAQSSESQHAAWARTQSHCSQPSLAFIKYDGTAVLAQTNARASDARANSTQPLERPTIDGTAEKLSWLLVATPSLAAFDYQCAMYDFPYLLAPGLVATGYCVWKCVDYGRLIWYLMGRQQATEEKRKNRNG
jgi:hypothetical protein